MASGTTPPVRGVDGASGPPFGPLALVLSLALVACNPVTTYRNLTGASRNDPNPVTTPNTQNLAAGAAAAYPNLATVPPPPTQELTEAELKHLTQSLVADRANAKYSDAQLRAGQAAAAVPLPPSAAAAPASLSSGTSPSVAAPPVPLRTTRISAPAARVDAGPVAAAGAAPATRVATAAPPSGGSAAAAANSAGATSSAPNGMESGLRKPGQPPEPGPMESSLVSPQIAETPQPEKPEPAPAPPRLVSIPAANNGGAAHLPPPPAPAAMPSVGAAAYQPPPPPVLASPAPTRTAMAPPVEKKNTVPAPVETPVAEIGFAAGAANLGDAELATLDKVAALYRQNPDKLRVVGYAAVGRAESDPMNSFRIALDRAQAVAAALKKTGIPADKISVEASPAKAAGSGDRAEVLLVH